MKALFCVFSGTGNTRRVCEELAREAEKYGVQSEFYAVVKGAPAPDLSGYDVLVAGFPVHAFNAPAPLLKFLKKLPKRKGMPAFLVRSSGEPLKQNGASYILPARILRRRGYDVRGEFPYVMPYNIIFRHSDGMAARMARASTLLSERYAKDFAEGKGNVPKNGGWKRFVSFVLRIEHVAMPIMGRTFRAAKSCVGCGKCAAVCPQKNITVKKGKPKFGGSCVGCMACAFSCPKDSVRISLLNGWRVNGAYDFGGEPASDKEVCSYCRKAYLRYFRGAEEKTEK